MCRKRDNKSEKDAQDHNVYEHWRKRDEGYANIVRTISNTLKINNAITSIAKILFLIVILGILIVSTISLSFVLLKVLPDLLKNSSNDRADLIVITTGLISAVGAFISSILVLPSIAVRYAFNPKEIPNTIEFLRQLQKYDIKIVQGPSFRELCDMEHVDVPQASHDACNTGNIATKDVEDDSEPLAKVEEPEDSNT